MLPGKTYRPEDYVAILWRRKWVWLLPFVVAAAGTGIGTQFLPDRYRSEARVQIVPQQVPENFVQPTVTTSLDSRLQAMSQVIQSRTRLEGIIQELNLYQRERQELIMEDVIERMRADIVVQIPRVRGRAPGSFTVGFTAENARAALQVTERLATQFISESLQDRTVQADQTSQFLETQLEEARRKLAEHETTFAQYRQKYAGELPTQVQSTLGLVQSTQTQLQILADTVNRDRDRQLVLEKTMADLMAISAARTQAPAPSRAGGPPAEGATAAERLAAARAAMRALQQRLKPDHPDMIRAERVVRDLEEKAAAEELDAPVGTGVVNASATMPPGELARLSTMQAERESLDRRIMLNQAEEVRLQKVLVGLRAKVEVAPSREAEATELMRDYDSLDAQYRSLLDRAQQSRIAADLERRQIGEQFRLIDPARLPVRPFSPDRMRLNLMGAMGGLGFGLALLALIEYRDTTFRTEEDFTVSLALPVLAVIPAMVTRPERRRVKRRRLVTVSASVAVMLGAIAVIVWKMDAIANWVR